MSAAALRGSASPSSRTARRILVAAFAVAVVVALFALAGWLSSGFGPARAPPPKNPFGTGLREAAAPASTGLGAWILAAQAEFYRSLTAALRAMKQDGGALWGLVGIGFLYGAFHAAGPGHGKAVIAGYLLATRRTLARGLGLSLAAALLQAAVAAALVGVLAALLGANSAAIGTASHAVEIVSFAGLVLLGLALLWRKTGALVRAEGSTGHVHDHHHHSHGHQQAHGHHAHEGACSSGCGHHHAPAPEVVERLTTWRETVAVVLAAGIRPCSGAIILLVFALSQGLLAAGVAGTVAMALGTALTTGALAAVAVLAKGTALRLAGSRGRDGRAVVAWLEVLAAAFVAALGATLLLGAWSGGLPS